MPKKSIDPRNDTSQDCICCGHEFDPQQDGGADFEAVNRQRIYFCESCAEEAMIEDLIQTCTPENTPEELTVEAFDKLTAWAKKGRILTFCETPIRTREDVEQFFDAISAFISWHPDESFADYVDRESGERTFDDRQATNFDQRMQEAFAVCDRIDQTNKASEGMVYALALESAQRAGWAPTDHTAKEKPYPEDGDGLTPFQQVQAVLIDMAEHLINARMDSTSTDEERLSAIDGGVAHELLTRANKVLRGTLTNFH